MVMDPRVVHSAIRIIGDQESATYPFETVRVPIGTGFILPIKSESGPHVFGYLVTAAHVVAGQKHIEMQPTKEGGSLYPPIPVGDWRIPDPKIDVAVSLIEEAPPSGGPLWANPLSVALPIGNIRTLSPGDPVFYIGVLTPLDRTMVRSATVGAVDQEGIPHEGGYEYPCHLIDCRSYGGFSGSPCFLHVAFPGIEDSLWPLPADEYPPPNHRMGAMAHVVLLAGMFTEHLTDQPGTEAMASRYGVGVMLRSQEIREVLMSDQLRAERADWDVKIEKLSRDGRENYGATSEQVE